jgi:hypothetical protein
MGAQQSSFPLPEATSVNLKDKLCVVVPTLNEAKGILATVERCARGALPGIADQLS